MLPDANPYAAPTATQDPIAEGADDDLTAIRQAHIRAEASIRSFGLLDYLAGAGIGLSGLGGLAAAIAAKRTLWALVTCFIVAALAAGLIYLGVQLRRLRPGARTIQTALTVLGLASTFATGGAASVPGALFWSFILLSMLWSRKANVVFTEHYRTVVVPATPGVKYRTSALTWILLALLLLFVVGMAAFSFAGRK